MCLCVVCPAWGLIIPQVMENQMDNETSTQGVIVALQGLGIGSGKSKSLIGNSLSAVLATVL